MDILFLGTGAADWPRIDEFQGDFYRRCSSLLVDGKILIDAGPHVIDAINHFGIDAKKIEYVLTTHRHSDHFCEDSIDFLISSGAEVVEIKENTTITLGKYTLTALRANHAVPTVHFIIFDGEKRLFYGLDGAWLLYDEISAIKENGIDCAILDATIGFVEGDYRIFEHNSLHMVTHMQKSLKKHVKTFCASHLAYTLHGSHESVVDALKPYGILVAFDGMKLSI